MKGKVPTGNTNVSLIVCALMSRFPAVSRSPNQSGNMVKVIRADCVQSIYRLRLLVVTISTAAYNENSLPTAHGDSQIFLEIAPKRGNLDLRQFFVNSLQQMFGLDVCCSN